MLTASLIGSKRSGNWVRIYPVFLFDHGSSPDGSSLKGIQVPILPGIAPIQSYASFLRMTKLCGTRVPEFVHQALDPIHVCPCRNVESGNSSP